MAKPASAAWRSRYVASLRRTVCPGEHRPHDRRQLLVDRDPACNLRKDRRGQVLAWEFTPRADSFRLHPGLHVYESTPAVPILTLNFALIRLWWLRHGCKEQQDQFESPGGGVRSRGQGPEGGPGPFAFSGGSRAVDRQPRRDQPLAGDFPRAPACLPKRGPRRRRRRGASVGGPLPDEAG